MRSWLPTSFLLILVGVQPASGETPACDRGTLMGFTPAKGDILARARLPVAEEKSFEYDVEKRYERRCQPEETDQACHQRVFSRARKRHPDRAVEVDITAEIGGYHTVLRIDGELVKRDFLNNEATAVFMKAESAKGKDVVLESTEAFQDPKTRAALVSVLRGSSKITTERRSVRLVWQPPGQELTVALKDLARQIEDAGIRATLFEPQTDGTVVLEITCP